jgi:hypothetical protein
MYVVAPELRRDSRIRSRWAVMRLRVSTVNTRWGPTVRTGIEQRCQPAGMEPEEHVAVQQPDPLGNGHVGEELLELGHLERFLVADHRMAVAGM